MKVLVCGSGGFIGRHLVQRLRANGHCVREGRAPEMDFARDTDPSAWAERLEGLDAVINAVGVLRESHRRPMDVVHDRAPAALFQACAARGVRRVIHVSALGLEGNATRYASSKLHAEAVLRNLHDKGKLAPTILRPSIVFGRQGASSRLFMRLAHLPLLWLPAAALRARLQPVAVADLAQVCSALLSIERPLQLECVGPQPLTLAELIATLRQQLGFPPASVRPLSDRLSRWTARCGDYLPGQPWCQETLALLQQDNVGEHCPFAALLQQSAIAPARLVETSWNA
jgi:uncharacterized protein YbjT (DUF2867 family)